MSHREPAKDPLITCRRIVILAAAAAALAAATPAAAGTTYNVSTVGELQAANIAVNAGPGGDLIVLAPGFYALTVNTSLLFQKDVTIQGDPSAATVIDGGGPVIITVSAKNFSIQNLTLQNGVVAIEYQGTGVFSGTGLTITGSNRAGIFVVQDGGGTIFLTNSTIANNSGEGIEIGCCAAVHLTNMTVSNNGVGVTLDFPGGNQVQITNSLIVANGLDCRRPVLPLPDVTSGDASFDSDGSCVTAGFGPGLMTNTLAAIGLGTLAANGGPTMTQAIPATSAAVNAGDNTVCPATDQRGFLRNDGACDIGAYEFGAAPVGGNTQIGSNVSVSPAPGVTVTFSQVTASGDTKATTGGPLPPSGFQVDGIVYDISTTATFTGPVTVCLPYSPLIDPTPRLYHYEPPAWVNRTTSVDAVNHVVCGTAPTLSPFAVLVTVPFASFAATVAIEHSDSLTKQGGDSFEVEGRGALGQASDGIAPDTEGVTLSLGSFSLTIPAGSFVKKIGRDEEGDETDRDRGDGDRSEDRHEPDDRITTYHFEGVIAGVSLTAEIQQGPKHTFRFQFEGRQADLGLVTNPVTVGLAIGDDVGYVVVEANIDK